MAKKLPSAHFAFTNLDKVYWPDEGYVKRDLISFYSEVAALLVPHLHDRPQSLHRHPDGINGKSFFQKEVGHMRPPAWVHTAKVPVDSKETTFLLCQNEATLLYMANLACIELHPWHSRIAALDQPDYLVIDLDPENTPFDHVVETAIAVHKLLDKIGVVHCCKTSGKRGMHIYVPLGAQCSYDQARMFAELIARLAHQRLPDITSLARLPQQRQGKVYIDFMQNGRGQTLAAPYSVRPCPGATVSTPLKWSEVKKGLHPARFTIKTVPKRLDKVGDLWQPILHAGADPVKRLKKLIS